MARRIRFILVPGFLGLAAWGASFAFTATRGMSEAPASTPFLPARTVRAQEVKADAEAAERAYTGVIQARYEADLAFRVGGKIATRHVEVGQRVRAGEVLLRLDPMDYRLSVKAAEADLAVAEAELLQATAEDARLLRLLKGGAVTTSDFDRGRSARDAALGHRDRARESLALARNRLAYCDLIADADGVITSLSAEAGQVVAEGRGVARFARDGEREAVVNLPENLAAAAKGARSRVTLWSDPGHSYPAALRELSPTADPVTRTYRACFTIADPGPSVALGMTATVHLAPADGTPGYALPLSSLLRDGDRPAVWVIDRQTGAIALSAVEVLEYRQEQVILGNGVKPGDLVVTAGVQKLDSAMTVRPWEGNP